MIVIAVQYINSMPMIYGIRCLGSCALSGGLILAPPSTCGKYAVEQKCDIALLPTALLTKLPPSAKIITNYSISATGAVDTVALLSNTPLSDITKIYRDPDSRTSVELCRILCSEKWKIDVEFSDLFNNDLTYGEALVAIGDKVFEIEKNYRYKIDLSEQWWEMTSLPFVFAVWVALTPEGIAAEKELNDALKYGVENIAAALPDDALRPRNLKYLTESIEYELNEQKRQAINLFISKIK